MWESPLPPCGFLLVPFLVTPFSSPLHREMEMNFLRMTWGAEHGHAYASYYIPKWNQCVRIQDICKQESRMIFTPFKIRDNRVCVCVFFFFLKKQIVRKNSPDKSEHTYIHTYNGMEKTPFATLSFFLLHFICFFRLYIYIYIYCFFFWKVFHTTPQLSSLLLYSTQRSFM